MSRDDFLRYVAVIIIPGMIFMAATENITPQMLFGQATFPMFGTEELVLPGSDADAEVIRIVTVYPTLADYLAGNGGKNVPLNLRWKASNITLRYSRGLLDLPAERQPVIVADASDRLQGRKTAFRAAFALADFVELYSAARDGRLRAGEIFDKARRFRAAHIYGVDRPGSMDEQMLAIYHAFHIHLSSTLDEQLMLDDLIDGRLDGRVFDGDLAGGRVDEYRTYLAAALSHVVTDPAESCRKNYERERKHSLLKRIADIYFVPSANGVKLVHCPKDTLSGARKPFDPFNPFGP